MKKAILVNYNFDPKDWWIKYGYGPGDVVVFDKSDDGLERQFLANVVKTENIGQVDQDKLGYLVDNYDDLPNTFLWAKTNLRKYVMDEEFELVKNNKVFTPLLTQLHITYTDELGWVNYYENGIYWERANSWFFGQFPRKYVNNWEEWCDMFGLPKTPYIPFAPGGNYILTKDVVHKYPKEFYSDMKNTLGYAKEPVEAQCAERSYYLMWK